MADYTIDAKGRPLGRLATQIAVLLQGKDKPQYEPRKVGGVRVVVKNIHQVRITGKKASQKIYYRRSGRPGGVKERSFRDVFDKTPERVLISAVRGMLPKNKLASERLKLLVIEKDG
jgi:large subunit ribosomal protein L13